MDKISNQNPNSKSRRKFLIRGGLGTLGLIAIGTYVFRNPLRRAAIGFGETLIPPYSGSGTEANLWIEITSNNNVLLHSPKVEMGQGTFTSFAQIIADEMNIDIDQVQVKAAATETGIIDGMSTGGSLSVAQIYQPLRKMAATMREKIKLEASKKLGVNPETLSTQSGRVNAGAQSISFAEALEGISDWSLPKKVKPKPESEYQYVGKPIPRIDLIPKVKGDAIFGMDVEMPDMLHATVVRPEHIGSRIKSINTSEAERMPGVVHVIKNDDWVGIVANSFAEALAAKNKVHVEWDMPKKWTEDDLREFLQVGEGNKMLTQKSGKALDSDDADVVSMEFSSPIGAHAQIEPNGALAYVNDRKATVRLSTQVIGVTQRQVAEALGFDKEDVNIIGEYLGGGFGRRLNTSHAVHAALMSREVGRSVKYFFTR